MATALGLFVEICQQIMNLITFGLFSASYLYFQGDECIRLLEQFAIFMSGNSTNVSLNPFL